jgi:hypothetical protein
MQGRFYRMNTGVASQCYWAQEVDLSGVPSVIYRDGMRGFQGIVPMQITKGVRPCDFLGNSASLHVALERVIVLLKEHGMTGFETYDVEVSGGKVELPKYYGLVAVGRGGHILPKESGVQYGSRKPDGRRVIMGMKRLVFDENQWDGSDFFYLDEFPAGRIIVTEKVRSLFKKEKVRNCELIPVEDVSF